MLSVFFMSLQGKLLLNFCLFPPSHTHFWAFFFNSWKKNIPPHKPVFKKKQK